MTERKLLSADEAAKICRVSPSTIRKYLQPAEVTTRRASARQRIVTYRYLQEDVEALRDRRPVPRREHPRPELQDLLREAAQRGVSVRREGRQAASVAHDLAVFVPSNMPTCCRRHAMNCVRHEGSNYDVLIQGLRSRAGYCSIRATLDRKVAAAIGDRMPKIDDCVRRGASTQSSATGPRVSESPTLE